MEAMVRDALSRQRVSIMTGAAANVNAHPAMLVS